MENNLVVFQNKALQVAKQLSDLKKKLKEGMRNCGINQFKNDYITISMVESSTSTSIDLKALEKNEPKLYADLLADYPKVTSKKATIRFTVNN